MEKESITKYEISKEDKYLSSSAIKKEALNLLKGNWLKASVLTILYFTVTSLFVKLFYEATTYLLSNFPNITPLNLRYITIFINKILTILFNIPFFWFIYCYFNIKKPEKKLIFFNFLSYLKEKGKISFKLSFTSTLLISLWIGIFRIPEEIFIYYATKNLNLSNLEIAKFSFLFFIGAVLISLVKTLEYSMALFFIFESKEITALKALKESKKLIKGYKRNLFVLFLSFLGWIFLLAIFIALILNNISVISEFSFKNNSLTTAGKLFYSFFFIPLFPYIIVSTCEFYRRLKKIKENPLRNDNDIEEN